ncbi:hypothetical protein JN06_01664 [Bacteroides zoogleoformans]|uniref:hypothetical protein n=1 Tax=Bacteroides zoogleoformans TaxID=28119 RepID=UPI0011A8AB75|nr:hypothetical protein [Bacteroides zoogleoformans]TWJ13791.1 hypothetical protein JN06_01664 [Bacteroides zoogleoformans]
MSASYPLPYKTAACALLLLCMFVFMSADLFAITVFSHSDGSALSRMFGEKKDVLLFLSIAGQHQLAECDIPHNQLACDEGCRSQ